MPCLYPVCQIHTSRKVNHESPVSYTPVWLPDHHKFDLKGHAISRPRSTEIQTRTWITPRSVAMGRRPINPHNNSYNCITLLLTQQGRYAGYRQ